jgi:hypothetical protein
MEGIEIKMIKIEEHLKNQDDTVRRIEKKIDDFVCSADLRYADKKETNLRLNSIEQERLSKIENAISWATKIIVGAVLLAILGLVIIK